MTRSIYLLCINISSDIPELEAFVDRVSSTLGGKVKTRLGRATEFHEAGFPKVSERYWTSRYFVTSFEAISDDVISLLSLFPDEAWRPFAGSISVRLIDRYQRDDDRNGLYLSLEALQAMVRVGAYFDLDVGEQGGFDSGHFDPVPRAR